MPSADRPSDTVCSYASVHDSLGAKTKSYVLKYKQFVIDYALEWEKVVTERVNAGLKKSEELRRDLDHYQKKVETMRLSVNQAMAKGKNVRSESQEKLRRNEEKLIQAKQNYNQVATDLCILMDEITERSWRDLHPLIVKCAQFDSTLSSDESKILASLNSVVSQLKNVATANGISPQPRLKDMASLKPELLSTRPGGVSGLAIEASLSPMGGSSATSPLGASSSISSYQSQAISPGSLAPSGLGGFPVTVASETDPMTSMSMLTISGSSAPAPTLDDVYSANTRSLSMHSAPNSGNLPPLAPMNGSFGSSAMAPAPRSTSFTYGGGSSAMAPAPRSTSYTYGGSSDTDSAYSGYSSSYYTAPNSLTTAPSSMPPPPPPSMPPPPPPSYGLTSMAMTSRPPDAPSSYGAPPMNSYLYDPPATTMPAYTVASAPTSGNYYGMPPPQPPAPNANPFGY